MGKRLPLPVQMSLNFLISSQKRWPEGPDPTNPFNSILPKFHVLCYKLSLREALTFYPHPERNHLKKVEPKNSVN